MPVCTALGEQKYKTLSILGSQKTCDAAEKQHGVGLSSRKLHFLKMFYNFTQQQGNASIIRLYIECVGKVWVVY